MDQLFNQLILLLKVIIFSVVVLLVYLRFPGSFQNIGDISWHLPESKAKIPKIAPEDSSYFVLADGLGKKSVEKHCLSCHSARLIVQNRMSGERWQETIRWMQQTQGLWDLGKDERIVVDYLAAHYAPEKWSRRRQLNTDKIQWYILNEITQ